jgi:cation:H+ antiporter
VTPARDEPVDEAKLWEARLGKGGMDLGTWLSIIGGLLLLILGGELLVRGAVQVASRLGVSPLVIGLTLVGAGTSAPELVTSVQAALSGAPGIAYGNIVGSNIANILLILGVSALLTPILVTSRTLKRDGGVMVLVTLVFVGLAAVTPMGPLIGIAFVFTLAAYVFVALRQERAAVGDHGAVYDKSIAVQEVDPGLAPSGSRGRPLAISGLTALAGLGIIVAGGNILVSGAIELARSFGISQAVIGVTVVAIGTSLPELVTSVVAALRREADVAFGNIIGSNIYNILGIGGATA